MTPKALPGILCTEGLDGDTLQMANALSVGRSRDGRLQGAARLLLSREAACLLAVVVLVVARLIAQPDALSRSLGDTDDATRLYQLREFLAHGRWWDLTLSRIGAPEPLVSHWSRLVDLGLATVVGAARVVAGPATAELAMRIVWPSLVLLGLLLLVSREAVREGSAAAGHIVAGLMVMSATALYQFQPGRVDHHNVQILCGVGGVLLLARSVASPRAGWAAGALIAAGLSVGLESATLVAPVLVVAVLGGLGRRGGLEGQMRAAIAMAVVLAAGVLASTPPAGLGRMACDAAALNLVVLVAIGAAGVALAARAADRLGGSTLVLAQLGSLAAAGGGGLLAYALMQPACLAGPFGQVAPEAWPIWLERVTEAQPISYLIARAPGETAGFILLTLLGIAAQARLVLALRESDGDRSAATQRELLLLASQALALVAACWQVKMMPYAAWLALPALARAIVTLPAVGSLGAPTVRIGAFVLLGQSTLAAVAGAVLALTAAQPSTGETEPLQRTSCSDTPTVAALAELRPGLVLAEVNLGPYIVALSGHRVVTAPYHRLDRSIVEGHRLLASAPDAAERGVRKLGVDYVVACRAPAVAGVPLTLQEALAIARPPSWLEAVPLASSPSLLVYRVRAKS